MAITKKQAEQLEKQYKTTWFNVNNKILEGNTDAEMLKGMLFGMESTMEILGYKKSDLQRLQKEEMSQMDCRLFYKWEQLQAVLQQIKEAGYEIHDVLIPYFYIIPAGFEKYIDSFENCRFIGLLRNCLWDIKKELQLIK